MLEENISFLTQYSLLNNSLETILKAIVVLLILIGIFKLFQKFILKKLKRLAKKTKSDVDDALIEIFQSIKPPFYFFLAFYLAFQVLSFGDLVQRIINIVLIIWVFYQLVIGAQIFVDYLIKRFLRKEKDPGTKSAYQMFGKLLKGLLWVFGALLVLSNLGVEVNSLLAGLGIGGVAVALALQNILGDLFSSFAIYFDKPFVAGDFIVVGEHSGIVKNVGIKTTRLQALQGEEVILSNKELTSTRIQNFKKLKERRIKFNFGVVYQTSLEKLKKINKLIKEIIESEKKVRFERVHFIQFDDSALSFEAIYYVESSEFSEYRDIHQNILFKIKNAFKKEDISMAYPTQTIYLEK